MVDESEDDAMVSAPEYDALRLQVEETRAQVKAKARDAIASLFKAFFAQYPTVTAIGWTQYTPYFNDGEPCEFSKHEFGVSTRSDVDWENAGQYDDNDEPYIRDEYELQSEEEHLKRALRRLERASEEDLFEAAFGDHVRVVATPAGFHVFEHSHD